MLTKLLIFLVNSFFVLNVASASIHQSDNQIDTRIKILNFSDERVLDINTQIDTELVIQFQEDEVFNDNSQIFLNQNVSGKWPSNYERVNDDASTIAMGDDTDWNVETKRNQIILKPSKNANKTNMIVVTPKKTYVFDLFINQKLEPEAMKYVIQFNYPEAE